MSDLEVVERVLTDRRSCRGFLDQQVSRPDIERLRHQANDGGL